MKQGYHEICNACEQCLIRLKSVFRILSHDEITLLQKNTINYHYQYGELIFKEGQRPFGLYIITKGKVKISKNGYQSREQIVRFARTGDLIGYRAMLNEELYSCSASAISDSELCFIPSDVIFDLMKVIPHLSLQFIKLLAEDLKTAEEKSMQLAQKTVRERVAEAILTLKEIYGFESDNATLNIELKRDEIAAIAGTVRETATRFLSELNHEKCIELSGKKIKILDLQRLENNANVF